jgi:hypothetical protein
MTSRVREIRKHGSAGAWGELSPRGAPALFCVLLSFGPFFVRALSQSRPRVSDPKILLNLSEPVWFWRDIR